jgi:CelD/BcsL family acetyltransferase involved in cellulose biosynthesis
MLQRIASEAPRWHRIDLRPMDVDSPLFSDTEQAMREAGMAVQRYFCFVNWYLLVEGRSYAEYAQSLPSPLRNTLKRKGRQLERSGRAEFAIITGPDGLDAAIDAYLSVYRNSWKSPEPTPEFMPSLIRLCAHEGWLRLGVARIDGEAAAAQLWIVCNGVASIYKLAYDERHAALSLGSLLTARMMQHVIDVDRVREVDYLTGDDAYKRDWMSHSRKRYGLVGYNLRSVRGLALAATHLLGGRIRRMLRRPSGEH